MNQNKGTFQKDSGAWGFRVNIPVDGVRRKRKYGHFSTQEEAARARDQYIIDNGLKGKGWTLNYTVIDAVLDPEDQDLLTSHRWTLLNKGKGYYRTNWRCAHCPSAITVFLHQAVVNRSLGLCPCDRSYREGDMHINHKDYNPLNNRRCNLEIIPASLNLSDQERKSNTGFIGVRTTPEGRFQAYYGTKGKYKYISSHSTAEEAARARDAYVIAQGLDLKLNFPA